MMSYMRYKHKEASGIINQHYMGLMEMLLYVYDTYKKGNEQRESYQNWVMLEIGSYMGESTQIFASSGLFRGGIVCVDKWSGDPVWEKGDQRAPIHDWENDLIDWDTVKNEFSRNTRFFPNVHEILPIRGDSHGDFTSFNPDLRFDFIYIDGDHTYDSVIKDIKKSLTLLKEGGIISGHDYDTEAWPEVVKAVNETIGEPDKVFMDSSWIKQI